VGSLVSSSTVPHLSRAVAKTTSSPAVTSSETISNTAEDAGEVAAREEDRARAAPAAQAVLLAEVREVRRDDGIAPNRAEPSDVCTAIDLAARRTNHATRAEKLVRFGGPLLQLARVGQLDIRRRRFHCPRPRCDCTARTTAASPAADGVLRGRLVEVKGSAEAVADLV
jgi:hypothetical protein